MVKWCTSCAAVRWTLVLLLVAPALLAQTTESEVNFEETSFYTDITTNYPETTEDPTTQNMEASDDQRRSERMVVVYVKPNPKAETNKTITELLDLDDVVYTTGDNETIVIKESEAGEDEVLHDDGDLMAMAGRSLNDHLTENVQSEAGAFESRKQPNSVNRQFDFKDVLNKWITDIDFNLSDLLKVNLANLLADDYEEMNRLMNQNLVEDTDEFMHATMTDALEPRNGDDGKSDIDQTVAASSEVQQVSPFHASTLPRPMLRSSGRIVPQYTYPLSSHVQRSDSAPSYILQKTGNGQPMALLPTGSAMRLPMQTLTLPRTVAQRMKATTVAPWRLIRDPQTAASNQTTPRSPVRFGERFVSRLPRPLQYMLNMTVGDRHTTTEKPFLTHRPPTVPHLPASSRQRAPNWYFQRPTIRNNLLPSTRIQGVVATTESRTTRPRVTTAAPSSNEFGARIRPFRYDGDRNSTNVKQNANKNKNVNREMKINNLRSNLVGKLVMMQTILDEKQENSGNAVKQGDNLAATRLNRKGLPNGILKPIVPLRPRVNFETTTTSLTETANETVPFTTTEFGFKGKKKYRRPPSFRKGGSYKLSAEKQTEDGVTSSPAKLRESMVILQITPQTTDYVYGLQNSTPPATPSSSSTTSEPEIVIESVETSPAANTTESTADLEESTLENATETAMPRDSVNNNEGPASSPTLELVDIPHTNTDPQGTTSTTVENTTETSIESDNPPNPSAIPKMVDTSVPTVDLQETATLSTDTTLPAEVATKSLLLTSASMDFSEEDTSMKSTIDRTNADKESKASPENQKEVVSADDFSDDDDNNLDDEGAEESDIDFPDIESDSETNEEGLSIVSTLSRLDRSVGSVSKEHSTMAVDILIPSQDQNIFAVADLSRGVMRPINLPYNILPANKETITR